MKNLFDTICNAFELFALKYNWLIKYSISEDNNVVICKYIYNDLKCLYSFKIGYNAKLNKIRMYVQNNRLGKEVYFDISSLEDFIFVDGITLHVSEFINKI
jgi:hypothetical protein